MHFGQSPGGGNTEIMIREALEGAKASGAEIEFVSLAGKNIGGCRACAVCGEGGKCVVADDMLDIYPKLMAADVIIIGSPVYFGMITSQTKAFIDRTYFLMKQGRKLENKVAGVITVGGRSGHEFSAACLMDSLTLHGMHLPGRAFAQSFSRELGAAAKEEKALKDARSLGERTVKFASRLAESK
jgi:multimeric flavodoxin WrbA